jgi:glycosyltransferase involved in cell wall biosynthesis
MKPKSHINRYKNKKELEQKASKERGDLAIIDNLKNDLLAANHVINEIKNSNSWKITFPRRLIKNLFINKPQNFFYNFSLFLRSDLSEGRITQILKRLDVKESNHDVILKFKTSKLSIFLLKCILNLYLRILKIYPEVFRSNFGYWKYINYEKKEYIRQAQEINRHINLLIFKPKFSIIIHIKNDIQHLFFTLLSLQKQVYVRFNIEIIINGAERNSVIKLLKRLDDNFTKKLEISNTFNPKLNGADFFLFLHPGESLSAYALYEFSNAINQYDDLDLIYGDEDVKNIFGVRTKPFFKPGWSPDYLESINYINFPCCISKSCVQNYYSGNLYDLLLRLSEHSKKIIHIEKVLGHSKKNIFRLNFFRHKESDVVALNARLKRTSRHGNAFFNESCPGSYSLNINLKKLPLVSIIIPTAGKVININGQKNDLIINLLKQIYKKTSYKNFEVIIIDNGDLSRKQLQAILFHGCKRVTFKEKIFNISKKLNMGVKKAKGEILLLMNDDIELSSNNWIEEMLVHFEKRHVGVVAPKLLYPSGEIQHAGVVFNGGEADHIDRFENDNFNGMYSHIYTRNYNAVTGAVMMTPYKHFKKVCGYTEELAISFNDIDYCLKLKKLGLYTVFTPTPKIIHMESKSRVPILDLNEFNYFTHKWSCELHKDIFFNERFFITQSPFYKFRFNKNVLRSSL